MKQRWDLIGCEPFSNIVGGLSQEQKHIIYENNYYELQKHKKLEEELGIDLITLFKALKGGIYIENEFGEMVNFKCMLVYKNEEMGWYFHIYNGYVFPKDYRKTWWLKLNRSE